MENYSVKQNFNCKSKNIIYSIICKNCGDFYVGKTTGELHLRINVHRQQTKSDELRFLKVNKHFHTCSHNEFLVFPLYKVFSDNNVVVEEKEKCLIKLLNPPLNSYK